MDITFITGNIGKAKQLSDFFKAPIAHQKLDLPEIQSLDLEEIVINKAQEAYRILQKPVLVEDTSLVFHTLNNLPGPFIKWFEHSLHNEGLCTLLNSYEDRSATATAYFCYYDGKTPLLFSGIMKGTIAPTPKGSQSFGWDPIFILEGETRTRGEMNDHERYETSMRKVALDKLALFLEKI